LQDDYEELLRKEFPGGVVELSSNPSPSTSFAEMYHWDSGVESTASVAALQDATVQMQSGTKRCDVNQLCYCGVPACMSTGFKDPTLGHLRVKAAEQALEARRLSDSISYSRQLQTSQYVVATVPPSLQSDVLVVFGLVPTTSSPLLGRLSDKAYGFEETFQLEDPRAQLAAVTLCDQWPTELKVTTSICWLNAFRDWWVDEMREEFPVHANKNFHSQALFYAENNRVKRMDPMQYIWISGEQKVKAMYFTANIDVSRDSGSDVGLKEMKSWDDALAVFNADEKAAAIKGAWHASQLWQSSEAEKVILDSTLITLIISLGCVFLGVLLFTRSIHLAFIVMFVVMTIIVGLLFVMVKILGWKIGAIEVLSLIVFVGLSVDYCLHLAHKYHSCHIADVEEESDEEEEDIPASALGTLRKSISGITGHQTARRAARITVTISETPLAPQDTKRKANRKILSQNRSTERFERAKYALERIGSAIVGSALTTMGSACFLLPCIVHVFYKLGTVVCVVTFYALVFTLIPLPAILMCIGPCGHDFKSLLVLLGRQASQLFPDDDGDEEDDEDALSSIAPATEGDMASMQRRYVLNMPGKGMGQIGDKDGQAPTRTRVAISG